MGALCFQFKLYIFKGPKGSRSNGCFVSYLDEMTGRFSFSSNAIIRVVSVVPCLPTNQYVFKFPFPWKKTNCGQSSIYQITTESIHVTPTFCYCSNVCSLVLFRFLNYINCRLLSNEFRQNLETVDLEARDLQITYTIRSTVNTVR